MPDLDRIRGPLALQPCHERDHTGTPSRAAKAAALDTWIKPELFRDGDH
jgi:hypothetical protein